MEAEVQGQQQLPAELPTLHHHQLLLPALIASQYLLNEVGAGSRLGPRLGLWDEGQTEGVRPGVWWEWECDWFIAPHIVTCAEMLSPASVSWWIHQAKSPCQPKAAASTISPARQCNSTAA
ncbi:hypothetical protein WJX77_006112 [Trebouxia sp. C0004]